MGSAGKSLLRLSGLRAAADDLGRGQKLRAAAGQRAALASALAENLLTYRRGSGRIFKGESHEARVSLNSSGLMPTAASTAASGVWLRRVLLAVAAFETLVGLIDLAVFVPDLNIINARLFIHPFFAIAALVLAARRYLRAAIVVLAAYILAALAIGWSPDLLGLSLLAQQVIFGPLAVTAIVLAILDKLLWLGAVFVALPSANLLLGMIPLIEFTIGVMIYGAAP